MSVESRASGRVAAFLAVLSALPAGPGMAEEVVFDRGLAGFELRIREDTNPYRVLGVFATPGETVRLTAASAGWEAGLTFTPSAGSVRAAGAGEWSYTVPPEPGLYPLEVVRAATGDHMLLNVFVQVPRESVRDGALNGYAIGEYSSEPYRGLPAYHEPEGFTEVTRENQETAVAPHFRLGQFLCKQDGGPPRYVVLQSRLLLKLEALLGEVNRRGHRADTFHVMSGYRTPAYNASIGQVLHSRHQFGDAADVFVDVNPQDGYMDDLDGNGRIDIDDARVLYAIFEAFDGGEESLVGGLGAYGPARLRGPFVHVDARGFRARW